MMRVSVLGLVLAASASTAFAVGACSAVSGAGDDAGVAPDGSSLTDGGPAGQDGARGGDPSTGGDGAGGDAAAASDGAASDGALLPDGALPDAGPPEVQLVGRFTASDGVGPSFAFPGSRLVARFNGTAATVKLSQTDGPSGGPSYFNVIIDGAVQPAPIAVTGAGQSYAVASGLMPGVHTVEVEKRTEPNLGVVRYEGFTFPGGGVLLSPPARPARRIELLSDSTIDGFGVEGTRVDTLAGNYCGNGLAPPKYNNVRKSMSAISAATLGAEYFMIAYSGKGITKNEFAGDTLYFQTLYDRTLPDDAASVWNRANWIPDAVVISVGGADFDGRTTEPPGFSAGYGGLVDKIRVSYPSAYIVMTVWSQIKNDTIATRTAMTSSLTAIKNARPADAKLVVFAFTPEANVGIDETGCQYHGNVTHHQNMAAALVANLKATIPGW
jgi:hypothetical protein